MSSAARGMILLASVVLGVAAISFVAFGWWTGGGSGSAGAAVATLGAPGAPSVSVANSVASVSWTAASAPGSGVVDYHVERRDTSGSIWNDVCGTTASIRITAVNCSDVPGDGTFVWRVTAFFHSWTATGSASNPATIDSKPPTGSITAPASGAIVAGALTVTSDSADATSGVASAQFQVSPAGAGSWSDLGAADTTSPYSASWNTTTFGDGLYDLRVITADNAGLTFTSPIVTDVVVDNTAPTVSLALASGPTGAYLSAGKVYFKASAAGSFGLVATVSDAGSGAASATFPILSAAGWTTHNAETDTTPAGGPFASSSFAWASGASAPAGYTATGVDRAGNSATSSITFTIDSTAPTGAVTAPVAAANVRGSVAVTSSSADAGSGVGSAQFQFSPAGVGTWSNLGPADVVTPYSTTWDTTASSDGLYDLRVITTDNVGTAFTSATIANVRVDNTAPSGSITAPAASAGIKGTFTVTSNSADAGSGVANALFQRSPAGANTWTNVAAADATSPYSASWVTTGVTDGLYDLQVVTTDKSGNTLTSALITNVRVDNTAPTGVVTAPAAAANVRGSVAVTSSSADAGSGVASAQFQISPAGAGTWSSLGAADTLSPYSTTWDTTAFTDGLYDLRVITTDNVATTFTSATIANVRVDNTAPSGSITAPAASAVIKGTFTVASNSADAGSGVANALFQRSPAGANTWTNVAAADATSPYSASWVTTGVTDGLYDLQVITTDKSGNALTSALVTNVRVDNTAPAVSAAVANGAPSAFQSGTRIYFRSNVAGSFGLVATVTDAGSGAASATFPVLATAGWTHAVETVSTPAGGPFASASFVWASGASTPGTYTVTVLDAAGNAATSAFTFTADVTAPTGSLTAPVAAANLRGSAAVTSNSADAGSGVASAQFQISPAGAGTWSNLGAADVITPFSTTWDTTASTDALYDLRVTTTDNVGITFTSATIANVRVDNTAPTGSITAPAANAFVNGATVAVSANSADAGSGVSSAQFQTSPHGANTWTNLGAADATSPYGVTWNTTTYADGQYDVRVITTDKSGNTFTSALVMAEVQNAAPTATAVQLQDGGGTAGKAEEGDRVVATFSQTLRVSTLCSTWSGDFSDQTLTALGDVTVTLVDGGAGNDTVTLSSASCTFHFGSINLGSTGYATGGNVTFSGSTTADRSTITWSAASHVLTITLGHVAGTGAAGTVAGSTAIYTPDAAIKNGFGTAITGTFNTGSLTLF